MKKFALLAVVLLLASVSVFAAGSSSTTQIIAVVGESVAVTGDLPTSTSIDVNATSSSLGVITFKSNISGSWTITVTSANLGHMEGETLGGDYPYTISIASLDKVSLTAPRTATVTTGIGNAEYALTAYYDAASALGLAADTYKDTITITVAVVG